jgi:hypothetical protein
MNRNLSYSGQKHRYCVVLGKDLLQREKERHPIQVFPLAQVLAKFRSCIAACFGQAQSPKVQVSPSWSCSSCSPDATQNLMDFL